MKRPTVPNPFDTIEEYQRYLHHDLGRMDREQLFTERYKIRRALSICDEQRQARKADWLRERLRHVTQTLRLLGRAP